MAEEFTRPGWYPAPNGEVGERWWNGASWSDSRRGQPAAAPPSPLPPVPTVVYGADNPAPQRPDPYAPPPVALSHFTAPGIRIDTRSNRLATAGLVTGAISIFGFSIVGPVAVVLSLLGIKKARELKAQGLPGSSLVLGVIGAVMGAIGTVQLIVAIISFVVTLSVDFS